MKRKKLENPHAEIRIRGHTARTEPQQLTAIPLEPLNNYRKTEASECTIHGRIC